MSDSDKPALVVFTAESKQRILDQRGSGDWVLNPKNAGHLEYLVCCRRTDWKNRAEGTVHRSAFLVGRIAGLDKIEGSENERNQPRFRITISEYAAVALSDVWRKDLRNPVTYVALDQLGINLRKLKFKSVGMPEPGIPSGEKKLTIADAKKALAATFGVRPEDVEITIRG